MRILQVISTLGFYGAENVLLEIAREHQRLGHESIVYGFSNSKFLPIELLKRAGEVKLQTVQQVCDKKLDIACLMTFRNFIRHNKIDVIHSHNYKSNFFIFFSTVGLGIPCVSTCHNWIDTSSKMKFYSTLDKIILKHFDKVIAVSNLIARELVKTGVDRKKVKLISNGINLNKFATRPDRADARKRLGIPFERKIIGTVGRLTSEKGHIYLINAAKVILKEREDVCFLIVGDGPLRHNLERQASDLPFYFTGVLKDVSTAYAAMDIFVLPSLTEGLPMVLLEAMASGVPVIASKVGDIPDVLENGRYGILVEPEREDELANAIATLLQDGEKRKNYAKSGLSRVKANYSSARMAENYLQIYRSVTDNTG